MYEASSIETAKDPLTDLIGQNPLLANIEGIVPNLPSEEEKQRETEAERKIEAKQQLIQDIVMGEGMGEAAEGVF